MANTYTNLNSLFTAIANAIRTKTNNNETIIADNFPTEIANIRTGFNYKNDDVDAITDYAFYGCEELNSVDCYNLRSIGQSAFENCINLKSAILYDNIVSVGENAFSGCSSDLVIYCMFDGKPDGWSENWNPDNREVVWLGVVETWDVSATETDNVTAKLCKTVNDDKYKLRISGNGAMMGFDMVNHSPWYTQGEKIISVSIENNITSIGSYAFRNCSRLTSITIPNSVTKIGIMAFYSCDSLMSITVAEGNIAYKSIDGNLYSIDGKTLIQYAIGKTDTHFDIPDSVTSIGFGAFYYCTNLTSVTIPDSVTTIGAYAFTGCNSLKSITFNSTIEQWNAITLGGSWNKSVPATYVQCTDGQVTV